MNAVIGGATGFTGKKLLKRLIVDDDCTQIYALVRKHLNVKHEKLIQIVVDFDHLDSIDIPENIDIAYCCLGTTIKKAQSKENFYKVDFEYITRFAKFCELREVKSFQLISAIGANPESYFFYQRVKGEAENFINSLDFPTVVIYRPSVIYGGRKEFRLFESFAAWISRNFRFLFVGKLNRIVAVTGKQLSKIIHQKSKQFCPGRWIVESEEIAKIK